MRRFPTRCGFLYATLAFVAGFALHQLSLDAGRADDPNSAGANANGRTRPPKSAAGQSNNAAQKKSRADVTALRAERALARRAAIAQEDEFGPGSGNIAFGQAGGSANGNSSGGSAYGSSAYGGSTIGSGMGVGSGMGSFSGSGAGSASSTAGTSTGTATTATGTQTSTAGTTAGQSQAAGTGTSTIPALNQKVLDFAVAHLGEQVGSGECWELGSEALAAAGAEPPRGQVFGDAVPLASMLPGDILEFKSARFLGANYWMNLGTPYHTAIVSSVQGTSVSMLNQNINGVKRVQTTVIQLTDLQSGTITVYRPAAGPGL